MEFGKTKNYYEVLQIHTDATMLQIKEAYRKLARKYHPDINKNPDAVEIFKEITSAYNTLSNPERRLHYDIINGIFKQNESEIKQEPHQSQTEFKNKKQQPPKRNLFKTIKFLVAKFKKNQRTKENHKPRKGVDLTTEITITPDEAVNGSKRIIHIRTTKTCPKCGGHHFTNGSKCPKCNGNGTVIENKQLTVSIPKNIKHGTKLRLKGEGASGKNGGANGDVFIIVKIETKNRIHFDKLNIYYNVPITPYEAALGEEITIPAFDGAIKLKLPPNTCSGQKFRIAKQGIKKGNKIGDIIVTVSIEFSHDLSDDEIELYKKLKNMSNDNVRKNFGCNG